MGDVAVNFALRQILIRRGSSGLQAQIPGVSTLVSIASWR